MKEFDELQLTTPILPGFAARETKEELAALPQGDGNGASLEDDDLELDEIEEDEEDEDDEIEEDEEFEDEDEEGD